MLKVLFKFIAIMIINAFALLRTKPAQTVHSVIVFGNANICSMRKRTFPAFCFPGFILLLKQRLVSVAPMKDETFVAMSNAPISYGSAAVSFVGVYCFPFFQNQDFKFPVIMYCQRQLDFDLPA